MLAASDPVPGIGDHLFILPNLILHRGESRLTYNLKVKLIFRNCHTALRGDWMSLCQVASNIPPPPFKRLGENDNAIGEGGLSRDTARRLYASAQRGRLGKAWRQLRTPPPMSIASEVWMQARPSFAPSMMIALIFPCLPRQAIGNPP